MAHYPADTFQEATEIAIEASNQLHGVINGDANAEVTVEDGSKIPSVRKAMVDSLYFKPPIAWAQGEYEDTYNQLREFVDGDVRTWWFAKGATVSTPVLMSTNPATDINWTLWSAVTLNAATYETQKRLAAEAGFNMVGSFLLGATVTTIEDVVFYETDGKYYAWGGTLPKVVPAGSTPATTGGVGAGAWVDRTDVTLRSDLNVVVKVFESVADMIADASLVVGQKCRTLGYYAVGDGGANDYEIVAAATGTDDGGSYIDLSGSGYQAMGLFVDGVVNVKQFGAVGDGITDDTSAIQASINLLSSDLGKIEAPAGVYVISNTLNILSIQGWGILGAGAGGAYNSETLSALCQTHFLWKGSASGTMLELDNCRRSTIGHINFVGQDGAGNKAGTIIKLISTTGATGGITLNHIGMEDADIGIECGDISTDPNNSDLLVIKPFMRNLTSGLRVNNENGLNYQFDSPTANNVTYIFDFEEGGSLTAINVSNSADYVIRIAEGGAGRNVGVYNFFGVRMESVGGVPSKFLFTNSSATTEISAVINVHGMIFNDNQPGSDYTFEIHAGAIVNIYNSRLNDYRLANISGLSSSQSSLHMEGMKLDVDSFTLSDYVNNVNANVNVTYDRIYRNDGKLIQKVESWRKLEQTQTHKIHETASVALLLQDTWYTVANINIPGNNYGCRVVAELHGLVQGVGYGGRVEEWIIYRGAAASSAKNIGSATDAPSATPRYSFQWVSGMDNNHMDFQVKRLSGGATSTSIQVLITLVNLSSMYGISVTDGAS